MGKVAVRTPTGLLLLPPDLFKDNLVIQCPHISIHIYGHMDEAYTRMYIATPRYPGTSTRPQYILVWTGANMDAQNYGVGQYQR